MFLYGAEVNILTELDAEFNIWCPSYSIAKVNCAEHRWPYQKCFKVDRFQLFEIVKNLIPSN